MKLKDIEMYDKVVIKHGIPKTHNSRIFEDQDNRVEYFCDGECTQDKTNCFGIEDESYLALKGLVGVVTEISYNIDIIRIRYNSYTNIDVPACMVRRPYKRELKDYKEDEYYTK